MYSEIVTFDENIFLEMSLSLLRKIKTHIGIKFSDVTQDDINKAIGLRKIRPDFRTAARVQQMNDFYSFSDTLEKYMTIFTQKQNFMELFHAGLDEIVERAQAASYQERNMARVLQVCSVTYLPRPAQTARQKTESHDISKVILNDLLDIYLITINEAINYHRSQMDEGRIRVFGDTAKDFMADVRQILSNMQESKVLVFKPGNKSEPV